MGNDWDALKKWQKNEYFNEISEDTTVCCRESSENIFEYVTGKHGWCDSDVVVREQAFLLLLGKRVFLVFRPKLA